MFGRLFSTKISGYAGSCLLLLSISSVASQTTVNFANEILPILSDKCFACHGPDKHKKTDLKLDSFEAAIADRGGYRAIDPSSPQESEVLSRIFDQDDPMPPAEADKQLSATEKELLQKWILGGGGYAKHWAFVAPLKSKTSPLSDSGNKIDAFVASRLESQGHELAPKAHKSDLARRVALVLTGLPPEPQQLNEYLSDTDEGAYEKLVEALLSSPRFGEHQARYWLDAVRYGDTHGLHLDNRRGIFPYRDWVVRAINNNLPLDDFITWQLAGDLLPSPSMEQKIATGYVRLNPTTSEGGVLPEEFQAKNNFDRVENIGTVFLGLTLTCARCHTHKYDPIPQQEYYELMAFFNSTSEGPLDRNSYTYEPVLKVPRDQASWDRWMALQADVDTFLEGAGIRDRLQTPAAKSEAKKRQAWKATDWQISTAFLSSEEQPHELAWSPVENLPGQSKLDLPTPEETQILTFNLETKIEQTLQLDVPRGSSLKANEGVRAISEAPGRFKLTVAAGSHKIEAVIKGSEEKGKLRFQLEDLWKPYADQIAHPEALSRDTLLTILGDAKGRFADTGFQTQARKLAKALSDARAEFTTTLVTEERSQPRETRILRRGEYNLPTGDPLKPGVIQIAGQLPSDSPRNRLGLAQWLTSREHPLTSRVLVNRLWQRIFGVGLVRTPEDFGLQGQQPTHPRLLDWLAVELQDSDWNLKHMLRLMVTSETFKQSSARRPELPDPQNKLLGRGPSYRLDAEVLRDMAIWASNTMDTNMGGEGVKPYQPDGMWLAMAHPASNTKKYVHDSGRKLYRRSLYVYWKRTSPHPMMTLFDAPSREASCVQRSRTNTSLQSLGLLNETQRVELARHVAERLLDEAESDFERINHLFQRLACREPKAREREACLGLLKQAKRRFNKDEAAAEALLSVGESPRNPKFQAALTAAWTQVASTVLASDVSILLY